MVMLVVAEHDGNELALASLQTISAAARVEAELHVVIIGNDAEKAALFAARVRGVSKVILIDDPQFATGMAEDIADAVCGLMNNDAADSYASNTTHIFAAATSYGKNFLPRVAALCDVAQLSEIMAVVDADTFKRAIYAGSVVTTIRSTDPLKVISVQATRFEPAPLEGEPSPVERLPWVGKASANRLLGRELLQSLRPDLTSAEIVVSGGRGLGSAEHFDMLLTPLAEKLNAALGASRAAVDAGYVSNDLQVGQTGKIVAPRLYLAIGISGAVQHLAGMKDSKIIVGINNNPEAPIFSVADYGIVGDLFEIVPELIAHLDMANG